MRITVVSLFEAKTINKINNLLKDINEALCKVPYGIDDKNRYQIDNLPFHFTIFATDKENEVKVVELMKKIKNDPIKVQISKATIMQGNQNSFVLYLAIKENESIKNLQREFYKKIPSEKYNPDKFTFHMTLHIDKDYNKVLKMQEMINTKLEPFTIEFNKLALYNYPGEFINEVDFTN